MNWGVVGHVLDIAAINLVLSGDNAVVVGLAARRLPTRQRRRAILIGGGMAVGLRLLLTAPAAMLLRLPLVQAGGGLLLILIAWGLVGDRDGPDLPAGAAIGLGAALRTIILADATMSLDNILAVGGAAQGDLGLLLLGLGLSTPLLLFGAGVVAATLNRLPGLVWASAGLLVWTAGQMVGGDPAAQPIMAAMPALAAGLPAALVILVAAARWLRRRAVGQRAEPRRWWYT